MSIIDPALLPHLLTYDPETGALTWRERPVSMFARGKQTAEHVCARWNNKHAGEPAFTSKLQGRYFVGTLLGSNVRAHRVIWAIMTGEWPEHEIDHIDGNGLNNRWANLRDVSHDANGKNSKRPSDNTSGIVGVSQMRDGRWQAYINRDRKRINLGAFKAKGDAIAARKSAEVECNYHRNHGRT